MVDGQQQEPELETVDEFVVFDAVMLIAPVFLLIENPDDKPRTLVISKVAEFFFLAESTDKCLMPL